MHLKNLRLSQFKNYEALTVDFKGKIHCLLGNNGSGKTNLLDAIHYLSLTKSALTSSDQHSIRTGENHFSISGTFLVKDKNYAVSCGYAPTKKKTIMENNRECSRLADHIGRFPVVLLSPHDIALIWNGSEVRRKFVDSLLCQMDRDYLENLIAYNTQLKQRNSYLRSLAPEAPIDHDLMNSYHRVLSDAGGHIYVKRKSFTSELVSSLQHHYNVLSGETEPVDIAYKSDQHDIPLDKSLSLNLERDRLLQRTSVGIHRDDLIFSLQGMEIRKRGSQGQQKSFLAALKLSEAQILDRQKDFKPILLLDDIFDKLDDQRIKKLMELVARDNFGQVFITDARAERCRQIIEQLGIEATFYYLVNGQITYE